MTNVRRELRAEAITPARARTTVREMLDGWAPDDVKLVELLTSEIVTNAVRHAATGIVLRVHAGGSAVRVEVGDSAMAMPHVRDDPGIGGYGLRIVEGLATRWGVEPLATGGKTVWFEVDAAR